MKFTDIWLIIVNFFILAMALVILGSGYSPFETRVLSLLLILISNVSGFYQMWGRTTAQTSLVSLNQSLKIRELLKDTSEDLNGLSLELDELEQKIKSTNITFLINSVVTSLVWIIAILALVSA